MHIESSQEYSLLLFRKSQAYYSIWHSWQLKEVPRLSNSLKWRRKKCPLSALKGFRTKRFELKRKWKGLFQRVKETVVLNAMRPSGVLRKRQAYCSTCHSWQGSAGPYSQRLKTSALWTRKKCPLSSWTGIWTKRVDFKNWKIEGLSPRTKKTVCNTRCPSGVQNPWVRTYIIQG